MKAFALTMGMALFATPVLAAQFVATGDWAPTREEACAQATALAAARAEAPISGSSCLCDKGDNEFSCFATVDVAVPMNVVAQEGSAALAKPAQKADAN